MHSSPTCTKRTPLCTSVRFSHSSAGSCRRVQLAQSQAGVNLQRGQERERGRWRRLHSDDKRVQFTVSHRSHIWSLTFHHFLLALQRTLFVCCFLSFELNSSRTDTVQLTDLLSRFSARRAVCRCLAGSSPLRSCNPQRATTGSKQSRREELLRRSNPTRANSIK